MDEVVVEAENETDEPSDITDIGTETVEEGNLNVDPWPRLGELFTFSSQSSDKKNLLFKCELCPPSKKPFSTYKTSHSNLRKHIKKVHPFSRKKFNELTNVRKLKRAVDAAGSSGATGIKQARLSWQTSKPSSKVNQENF
ncbi:Hypothetical predicted protein [Paramuricea clavata]|uniref:Uncharacterized protein n=1 Tax=Paramuricea clavata TaxID=317549 RepID=A0A6S7FM94_PARCT|nr:Hypothetical predicted protein [Paramuricea clavata]